MQRLEVSGAVKGLTATTLLQSPHVLSKVLFNIILQLVSSRILSVGLVVNIRKKSNA